MNRRNFLKKVGAVVASTALLKKKKSVPFVDVDALVTWKHFYAEFKFESPLSPKYPYGLPPWMEIT